MIVRTHQGDTVDLLAWRHFGGTVGKVEAILEANPGLCDLGPTLPIGIEVDLPAALAAAPGVQDIVKLWD